MYSFANTRCSQIECSKNVLCCEQWARILEGYVSAPRGRYDMKWRIHTGVLPPYTDPYSGGGTKKPLFRRRNAIQKVKRQCRCCMYEQLTSSSPGRYFCREQHAGDLGPRNPVLQDPCEILLQKIRVKQSTLWCWFLFEEREPFGCDDGHGSPPLRESGP